MGTTFSAGTTTANITGNVTSSNTPGLPTGATVFCYSGTCNNTTTTLRTAAAGKRLYICSISGTMTSGGSGGAKVQLTIGGSDKNLTDTELTAAGVQPISFASALPIQSDDTGALKVTSAAAPTLYYCIYGYEV